MSETAVQTFVEGSAEDIARVYDLAQNGVAVEYEGLKGDELAETALRDLCRLGVEPYRSQVSERFDYAFSRVAEGFEEGPGDSSDVHIVNPWEIMLQPRADSTDVVAAFNIIRPSLTMVEDNVPTAVSRLALAAGKIMDTGFLEAAYIFAGSDEKADPSLFTLGCVSTLIKANAVLHSKNIPGAYEDLEESFQYGAALAVTLAEHDPNNAKAAYDWLQENGQRVEEAGVDVLPVSLQVLLSLATLRPDKHNAETLVSTYNAIKDLLDYDPENLYYQRLWEEHRDHYSKLLTDDLCAAIGEKRTRFFERTVTEMLDTLFPREGLTRYIQQLDYLQQQELPAVQA